jgi:hypothetical protein
MNKSYNPYQIKQNILSINLKHFKTRPTPDDILTIAVEGMGLNYKAYCQTMTLFENVIMRKIYYWELEYNITEEKII